MGTGGSGSISKSDFRSRERWFSYSLGRCACDSYLVEYRGTWAGRVLDPCTEVQEDESSLLGYLTNGSMSSRVLGMGARVFHESPPTPEHRIVGWHCVYHEQQSRMCHNPLDCDYVPIWALTVAAARERMAKREFV